MPRNRISDDVDHVPIDPKPSSRSTKKLPPPNPLPKYTPMSIQKPWTRGHRKLPPEIDSTNPYAIFGLFFSETVLVKLCDHTNKYAQFYQASEDRPYARYWKNTTVKELHAYIGVYIWMGLFPQSTLESFWNADVKTGPVHQPVTAAIGLKRWQQIDRFFHISEPFPPDSPKQVIFEKLEP